MRKLALNDKKLLYLAYRHYLETITKTSLDSTEKVFSREPIRHLAICLNTNEAFLASKQLNPFHFRKFNLELVCFYRNGLPVADSHIKTTDVKQFYFNTLSDLAYIDNGQGIILSKYTSHFLMVIGLTNTQQASHDFVYPELNN